MEYTATALMTVYKMPTGLSAAVSFTGPTTSASDDLINVIGSGASYGTEIEAASRVCGADNECPIVLTLTGRDADVSNAAEIAATGQVTVVDASAQMQYGTTPTYAYDAVLGKVTIKRYTATASETTVAP